MKTLLVVNPKSGGGKTEKAFPQMHKTIERALGSCDVELTRHAGHGIDLARKAADEGYELVVAVGGDGTFNEVANGLLAAGRSETHIGLIGQGTGGDFRKTVGLDHRLDAYLAALGKGGTRALDVGRVTYTTPAGETKERHFVNIVSCGMGGLVDRYVADASRTLGGTAAYFGASVKALVRAELGRLSCTVTHEGSERVEKISTYMLAICNGQYFGSGMKVAPMADLGDGRFEVVGMGPRSKVGFALTSGKIYSGKHLDHPGAVHFGCQKITVALENDAAKGVYLIDLDGEPLAGLPMTVEMIPGALRLRA